MIQTATPARDLYATVATRCDPVSDREFVRHPAWPIAVPDFSVPPCRPGARPVGGRPRVSLAATDGVGAMMLRLALAFVSAALLGALLVDHSHAWEDADVSRALTLAAERHGVSRWYLRCISWHEARWDPYAVGDEGQSFGLFQLFKGGLLPNFYARGYRDPFNPYQSADFAASWIRHHGAGAWSVVRVGLC